MSWPNSASVSSRVRSLAGDQALERLALGAMRPTAVAIIGAAPAAGGTASRKLRQQLRPRAGEHRLGMELHAPVGQLAVAHRP